MTAKPLYETKFGDLLVSVYRTNEEMGREAAKEAADIMQSAIYEKGRANIIIATGNSQLAFLAALREMEGIDWSKVNVFHLDEYVGIDPDHPASFPKFLYRQIINHVRPKAFYPIPGQAEDLTKVCQQYEELLRAHPADLCAVGIGENGHLAFNDPAIANFDDSAWVKVVQLEETSRRQQVGEGHFDTIDEVPEQAITLTIPGLLAAKRVLAVVPEKRKAEIVFRALNDPISAACPATILRRISHAHLFLDSDSAAKVFTSAKL